ncbi:MAG: transposase [Gammaproteobacteria bacterium]
MGITAYIDYRLTNGPAEGTTNRLRMIARPAFGFHSAEALIAMLFLAAQSSISIPYYPASGAHFELRRSRFTRLDTYLPIAECGYRDARMRVFQHSL